jgi:hypothetical protein
MTTGSAELWNHLSATLDAEVACKVYQERCEENTSVTLTEEEAITFFQFIMERQENGGVSGWMHAIAVKLWKAYPGIRKLYPDWHNATSTTASH